MNLKISLSKSYLIILFLIASTNFFGQKNIEIEGVVVDESENPIPYAAVGIPSKQIGTATNDDGGFYLKLSADNLSDTLEISTIGFKTYRVKIQDYIDSKTKKITLVENVVTLDAIVLEKTDDIVKKALKKLKKTTLSDKHQMDILYRRSSVENGKTRFLVEHLLNVIDYGPSDIRFDEVGLAEVRKSADYRFAFKKQPVHAIHIMAQVNPLRQDIYVKDYDWERISDTSYDGEDVLVIQGTKKNQKTHKSQNWIKFYIGLDTYGIYKVDVSRFASKFAGLTATYIYKKNDEGKLVLSYHNREARFRTPITAQKQKLLNIKNKNIQSSYRHEAIVLKIEKDRKKFEVKNPIYDRKDIGDYEVDYHPEFWKTVVLPPETKFYKKSVKDLESIYGVPLETQFKAVNK
ncbi:carboxypeptidase-like regulatory domain-containing protein [Polaribacter aestuariivivens]|uniref:carboxypeptidase-like regulatory domain-containing protein n=1 Tax=Polaribacter aestuariivivens TaxID=2304626 RepID=UPI0014870AB7|nr:carboxypeptidase-like regulatory domain-containing protein [Polaribacter aestuariivivens]